MNNDDSTNDDPITDSTWGDNPPTILTLTTRVNDPEVQLIDVLCQLFGVGDRDPIIPLDNESQRRVLHYLESRMNATRRHEYQQRFTAAAGSPIYYTMGGPVYDGGNIP